MAVEKTGALSFEALKIALAQVIKNVFPGGPV
jgi:hypothetical protein